MAFCARTGLERARMTSLDQNWVENDITVPELA